MPPQCTAKIPITTRYPNEHLHPGQSQLIVVIMLIRPWKNKADIRLVAQSYKRRAEMGAAQAELGSAVDGIQPKLVPAKTRSEEEPFSNRFKSLQEFQFMTLSCWNIG